ncbi:MAG: MlaD family protein [Ignavibacteria bacterium]|nr:MlaD family protein [Ignavibacteria bacterium]
MDKDKRTLVKVGITILVSIIIVLYGIAFLKDLKFGMETNTLRVYFDNVNGLKAGDPVSVNGVQKGKVQKIDLVPGDSVIVEFSLSKDVTLKKDYRISISMVELMSGKQVYIKPGSSDELADITKPLSGDKTQDITSLIGTMNEIGGDVRQLTSRMDTALHELSAAVRNINQITGDEGLKSNIRSAAGNFNLASRNLNLLISETRNNLNNLTYKLSHIASNVDNTVSDTRPELRQTMEDIRLLTSRLDSLALNLNSFVNGTLDSNSTVKRLLTEDDIYENLNKTLININKLVRKIEKDGVRLRLF